MSMNKTRLKHIIISILAFAFTIGIFTQPVYAASGKVAASGGGTINVGDTISITFGITSDENLYGLDFGVSYDPSVLEYIQTGTADNGGNGAVRVVMGAVSGNYTIKFKALNPGTSSISVSNAIGVAEDSFQMETSGTSVTVAAPIQHSSDNSLKSLTISPGSLSPSFSQGTTNYTATVSSDTSKIVVSATPSHNEAEVTSVSGADNLSAGRNDVKVVVTAEDGSTATYTIVVTREEGPALPTVTPTPSPSPVPELPPIEVNLGDKNLIINSDFEESSMPEAFSKRTMEYNNQEISVAASNSGDLILFYLTDHNGQRGEFYIYDEEKDSFTKYIEIEGRGGRHIILPLNEGIEVPVNFLETTFSVDGYEINGWQVEGLENGDFYLVYAMDGKGNKDLYSYDSIERTFQRFSPEYLKALIGEDEFEELLELQASIGSLQDDLNKSNDDLSNLRGKYNSDMKNRLYIIIGLAITCIILFILLTNLLLKNKFLKEDLAEIEEADYDFDLSDLEESESTNEFSPEFVVTEEVDQEYDFEEVTHDISDEEDSLVSDSNQEKDLEDDLSKSKTSSLENASLEEIFEYLNIDDEDIEEN